LSRKVLLLGAGSSKTLRVETPNTPYAPQTTTVDIEASHKPDLVWDLNVLPWPFQDATFDEVHAYELLEHLGQQGDAKSFFAHFYEIWRLLKPGGYLGASVPRWDSLWAWGDPSHRRIISEGSLTYLDRTQYKEQVGKTAMTDFRSIWHGDFEALGVEKTSDQLYFLLRAHKPARA
jgi:SAM-dependent methyltransferase